MRMKNKILMNQLILVLIVFVISQIILTLVLEYLGLDYFDSTNWSRWDSGHYLQIANCGYEFFPCAGKFGYPLNAQEMCGNTGWFPGYPLLIKLFSFFFHDSLTIAGILSKLNFILSLFLVLKISKLNEFSLRNILFLSIPAFSFSFIYYNTIFPISSILLCTLASLYFFIKRKIWITGIFCFLASFFYPTGFLLSIVFAIIILLRKDVSIKQKTFDLLIPTIMGVLGFLLVFIIFQITVNDWAAFIKVQAKYGHGFQSPIKNMKIFFQQNSLFNPSSINNFIQYQSLVVVISYCLFTFYFFYYRKFYNELYLWTFLYITLFFIFPWSVGGDLSRYRAESLLFPFVFLLQDIRTKWLATILICLLFIGIPISYLFFNNTLI